MSIHWIDRVWKLSRQKGSGLLLMLAIADSANEDGFAWPGKQNLANKTRMSSKSVQRLISQIELEDEITVRYGGNGAKSTNKYAILIGRPDEEQAKIKMMMKSNKGDKLIPLFQNKGDKSGKGDTLSGTNPTNKGDTAMSHDPCDPSYDHVMNGWMENDHVCVFLRSLPGFNQAVIEKTRREIVAHHYDLAELPHLWNECALADNPIGLFTHKVTAGQHSVDWQMAQIQQRHVDDEQAAARSASERVERKLQQRADREIVSQQDTVTPEQLATWQQLIAEISIDLKPATIKAYIEPAQLVSVNGVWTIEVPAPEWWGARMGRDLPRIYRKLTGEETQFNFVKAGERTTYARLDHSTPTTHHERRRSPGCDCATSNDA
jgi:hypothetical protein